MARRVAISPLTESLVAIEPLVGAVRLLRVEVLVAFVVGYEILEERSFLLIVVVFRGPLSTLLENLANLSHLS